MLIICYNKREFSNSKRRYIKGGKVMRKLKKLGAIVLTSLFVVSTVACGSSSSGKDDVTSRLVEAQKKMEEVKNAEATLEMKLEAVSTDEDGKEESLNMSTTGNIVMFSDPIKAKIEMNMALEGLGSVDMNMYMEEKDGKYISYTNLLGSWTATEVSLDDVDQYSLEKNAELYIKDLKNVKEIGTEEINGENTTKIEGEVSGEQLKSLIESSGMLDLTGLSETETKEMEKLLANMGDLKLTVWLNDDNYMVKVSEDLTEFANKLVKNLAEEDDTINDASFTNLVVTISYDKFNEAQDFEIPEDARNAEVTSTIE